MSERLKYFRTFGEMIEKSEYRGLLGGNEAKISTLAKYNHITNDIIDHFNVKSSEYGNSWNDMECMSLIDQIYIKANRIKSVQGLPNTSNDTMKVDEPLVETYVGVANYSFITFLQCYAVKNGIVVDEQIGIGCFYDIFVEMCRDLMLKKTQDYGEVWKLMDVKSFADFIIQKLKRIKKMDEIARNQSNENGEANFISEGIDAGLMDIFNYAVFAIIRLESII